MAKSASKRPFHLDKVPDTSEKDMDILESTFFRRHRHQRLPEPSEIDISKLKHGGVIKYPEFQLLVKFGRYVSVTEAVTMWAVKAALGNRVPVPELYGWRVRDEFTYIYMELINGVPLQERWNDLTTDERKLFSKDLQKMLRLIHKLPHERDNHFIGTITHGPLLDRMFHWTPDAGPFKSLKEYFEWLEWLPQRFLQPSQRYKDPYLEFMPKDSTIVFTHADLHPTNIMISATGSPRILAIIDWGQSGWYPDWWEYFKMCYTTDWEGDWRKIWIPKIVQTREDILLLMAEYTRSIGAL